MDNITLVGIVSILTASFTITFGTIVPALGETRLSRVDSAADDVATKTLEEWPTVTVA